jgi:hypothetical protein
VEAAAGVNIPQWQQNLVVQVVVVVRLDLHQAHPVHMVKVIQVVLVIPIVLFKVEAVVVQVQLGVHLTEMVALGSLILYLAHQCFMRAAVVAEQTLVQEPAATVVVETGDYPILQYQRQV